MRTAIVVAAAVLSGLVARPLAAPQSATEPALKAAFILNFVRFAEWPADVRPAPAPLRICSTDDDVAEALVSVVAGASVRSRPVAAARVTLDQPLESCAALYVAKSDRRRVLPAAAALHHAGVLTVGEGHEFAADGGVIGFFVEDGRLRFAINVAAAERARVRLPASVLTLARIIKDESR